MLPQISYTSSNFPNASAASPCSPLTSSSIFIHFFIFVSFFNLLLLLHSDGGFGLFFGGFSPRRRSAALFFGWIWRCFS